MGFASKAARQEWHEMVHERADRVQASIEKMRPMIPGFINRITVKVNDQIRRTGTATEVRLKMRGAEFAPATWLANNPEGEEFLLKEFQAYDSQVSKAYMHDWQDPEGAAPRACYLILQFDPPLT